MSIILYCLIFRCKNTLVIGHYVDMLMQYSFIYFKRDNMLIYTFYLLGLIHVSHDGCMVWELVCMEAEISVSDGSDINKIP